jgi:ribose 5-phosphate isomerase RpiB
VRTTSTVELARRRQRRQRPQLGACLSPAPLAEELLNRFLATLFEGGRHQPRVAKLDRVTSGNEEP